MLDSGDMSEVDSKIEQPTDVVATEVEEGGQPQAADTDDIELYVEDEGDQQEEPKKHSMTEAQAYAAWKEEKDKRKRKNEELQKEREEKEQLRRELDELRATVTDVKRGPRPDPYDFGSTEEFYEALDKWNGSNSAPAGKQPENKPEDKPQVNDMAEFYLHQKEAELSAALPGYHDAKASVIEQFKQYGGGEGTITALASIGNSAGIDVAKAVFAMSKSPALIQELNQAAASGNQFAIAGVLKKAAEKVKTRQKRSIDTQPEPTVNSSGPINNTSAAIQKARDAWVNAGPGEKLQKWNEYQAAKKKVKNNG